MRTAKTAVVASCFPENGRRTGELLEELGLRAVSCVRDGREALQACRALRPHALVADEPLPGLDGWELARRVRALDLPEKPGIVLTRAANFPWDRTLPGVTNADRPLTREKLERALSETAVENRRMGGTERSRAEDLLNRLGLPEHPGRDYLLDAVFLAGEDQNLLGRLTGELYPMVARRNASDARAVERAMRHAIERAWQTGSIEEQYRLFRDTIDAARGKPTCGEMIAQLTQLLRMEG